MSYSFSVRAATKSDAVVRVAAELAKVVASQPIHAADQAQAQAVAETFILVVDEPSDGFELSISVSGWLQWRAAEHATSAGPFTGANVSVSVSIVAKID